MNAIVIPEVTERCFNWCKEQSLIHQGNEEINDLSIIAIAMTSLVINKAITDHSKFLIEKFNLDENNLEKLHDATYFFAFILMALYIIYRVFLK